VREIFGSKRQEVTEGWRKLLNGELHNFYPSSNIIRVTKTKDEMDGPCSIEYFSWTT